MTVNLLPAPTQAESTTEDLFDLDLRVAEADGSSEATMAWTESIYYSCRGMHSCDYTCSIYYC